MFCETFPVGSFGCNCSILADESTGDAIIVDPGADADDIIARVRKRGFSVRHLIHTHAHIDHVGATAAVKETLGGRVALHREELFLYDNLGMQSHFLGIPAPKVVPVDDYLEDGDTISVSGLHIDTLHTPGHTPGSLCFLWKNPTRPLLFSGDTLFQGSIGRTDLWGGDSKQILVSIRTKLLPLDDTLTVIPGHGPVTQIGLEKRINPFLKGYA